MTRRLLLPLLALPLLLAGPAAAVDVDAIATQLGEDPVLVSPDSTVRPDEDAVRDALRALAVPTYVVVLPQADVDLADSGIDGVLLRVVEALADPRAVAVVVTDGGELQAGEGGASGVVASRLLDRVVQARAEQDFDGAALTDALLAFADGVEQEGGEGAERGIDTSGQRAVVVAGLAGMVVAVGALLWVRAQRKVRRAAPLSDATRDEGGW